MIATAIARLVGEGAPGVVNRYDRAVFVENRDMGGEPIEGRAQQRFALAGISKERRSRLPRPGLPCRRRGLRGLRGRIDLYGDDCQRRKQWRRKPLWRQLYEQLPSVRYGRGAILCGVSDLYPFSTT